MNKGTKDNKGFSLVELIVVILIMAILAVALTPQVLKWVKNARIANDKALMDTLKSNCMTALTNEEANAVVTEDVTLTVVKPGEGSDAWVTLARGTGEGSDVSSTILGKKIAEYSGFTQTDETTGITSGDWDTFTKKTEVQVDTNTIIITIHKGGKVESKYGYYEASEWKDVDVDN